MQLFWLAALVIFIAMEAATCALVSLWFVGGSVVSLFAAIFGAAEWVQVILFVITSACLLFALRPLAKKYLVPKKIAMNARGNIGKVAVVTEEINNLHGKGAVRIAGVLWSARSTKENIEEGAIVRIVEIEGAKVCVERAEKKEEVSL